MKSNGNNSTTAFAIQTATSGNLVVADTTNSILGVGGAPTAGGATLQVTGQLSVTTLNSTLGNTPICQNTSGYLAGCSSSASVATLQGAYNASVDSNVTPDIVLSAPVTGPPNSSGGGLIVQDSSSGIGGNLFAIQNNGGTKTYLGVTTSTVSVTDNINVTGNLQFQGASTINVASATTGTQLTIQAGAATSGTNVGGNLLLQGGTGASTGSGGAVNILGGTSSAGAAGAINIGSVGSTNISAIDGASTNKSFGGSSGSVSLTTIQSNDVIVMYIGYEGGLAPTVSSVTSAHLTWHRRGGLTLPSDQNGASDAVDEWWASASSPLTAESITVTLSGGVDDANLSVFGVSGAANYLSPWDTNVALPATATGTSSQVNANVNVSTTSSNDIILGLVGNVGYPAGSAPTGWSGVSPMVTVPTTDIGNNGGNNSWNGGVGYQFAPTALTNSPISMSPDNGVGEYSLFLGDAIVGTAPPNSSSTVHIADNTGNAGSQIVSIGSAGVATNSTSIQGGSLGGINIGTVGSAATSSTIHIADTSGNGLQNVSIGSNGSVNNVLTLDAGTGPSAIQIGNSATAHGIKIGTGAATQTIVIGSTSSSSALTLQAGAGALTLQAGTGGLNISTGGIANTVQIGNTSGAVTQTINIGSNSTASSTNNVVIGSTVAGTTTIRGSGITQTVTGSSETIKTSTNSATAFQLQNAAGNNILTGDTSGSNIIIGSPSTTTAPPSSWTNTTSLPSSFSLGMAAAANGYVYALGGTTNGVNNGNQNGVYYASLNANGSIGSWVTSTNPLPAVRSSSGIVTLNGYIYVIGGGSTNSQDATSVYYAQLNANGSIGSWGTATGAGVLPQKLAGASVVAANGYIYVIGGNDNGTIQNTVYYTQPNSTTGNISGWTTSGVTLPTALAYGSAVAYNGYVYQIGGSTTASNATASGLTPQATVEAAQISSNGTIGSFSSAGNNLPVTLALNSVVAYNGAIYSFGGQVNSGGGLSTPQTIYSTTISSGGTVGSWSTSGTGPNSGSGIDGAAPAIYNGYVYLIGGYNGVYGVVPQYASLTGSTSNAFIANATITGSLTVQGGIDAVSYLTTAGNLNVGGNATFGGNLSANGFSDTAGNLLASGSATITNGLSVGGSGSTNSATFFQIQNSSNQSLLTLNTLNQRLSVDATTVAMSTPTGLNGSLVSGGLLSTSNNYSYKVTAIDGANGETAASSATSAFTPSGSNLTVSLTWSSDAGAYGYKVYRSTNAGGYYLLTTIAAANSPSYKDTGALTTSPFTLAPSVNSAYFTNNSTNLSSSLQLAIGGNGTPTGQLYVSGDGPTLINYSSVGNNLTGISVVGSYAYVINDSLNTLQIFDVSNPTAPTLLGSVSTGSNGCTNAATYIRCAIYVQGRYAYVANYTSNTLQIFGISNPSSPVLISTTATGSNPSSLYVQGSYAYVVNAGSNTFQVFNVSNPTSPTLVYTANTYNGPHSIYVQGRYAYVGSVSGLGGLQIFDISNPTTPTAVSNISLGGDSANAIYVQGHYAYIADTSNAALRIFDISNPANPVQVGVDGNIGGSDDVSSVYVQGRYAYIGDAYDGSVCTVDVSNPALPTQVGNCGSGGQYPLSIAVQGRYAYAVSSNNSTGGLAILDLGGAYVQQLQAGGTETGTLQVDTNASIGGDAAVIGGLQVGTNLQVAGGVGINGNISLQGSSLTTPSTPSLTTSSGGSLSGTYYYELAAVSANGTTAAVASSPASISSSRTNTLTWSTVSGATGYVIYRSTDGTTWYANEVSGNATTLVDTGITYTWLDTATPPTVATTGGNLTLSGNLTASSGNINAVAGAIQTNSINRIDNSGDLINIANITGTAGITIAATGSSNGIIIKNSANYASAFQVQDISGYSVLSADTTTNNSGTGLGVLLGTSSVLNGQLSFANASNSNTVSLISGTTSSTYSLILPTSGPSTSSECLENGSSNQLQFAACLSGTGTGLAKNSADTSSVSNLSANGYLYNFNNCSNSGSCTSGATGSAASGVLQLNNYGDTNSTLNVVASVAPSSGQGLINVDEQSASPSGNLLSLQAGSSPTSVFTVSTDSSEVGTATISAGGTYTSAGSVNYSSGGTVTISSATGANAINIDTGDAAAINIGMTHANAINVGAPITLSPGGNALAITHAPTASTSTSLINLVTTGATFSGSSSGTFIGVSAASGFGGDLINLQVNGTSKFSVDASGDIRQGNGYSVYNTGLSAPSAYSSSNTMTANDLLLERVVYTNNSAALTLTTPTAAQIVTALGSKAAVGDMFSFLIVNGGSSGTLTISNGSGFTFLSNSTLIARSTTTSSSEEYTCRVNNISSGSQAVTCY